MHKEQAFGVHADSCNPSTRIDTKGKVGLGPRTATISRVVHTLRHGKMPGVVPGGGAGTDQADVISVVGVYRNTGITMMVLRDGCYVSL